MHMSYSYVISCIVHIYSMPYATSYHAISTSHHVTSYHRMNIPGGVPLVGDVASESSSSSRLIVARMYVGVDMGESDSGFSIGGGWRLQYAC